LEHTNRGTLFLDEIGDLPLELQGKLLRVLQEGEFTRVGSSDHIRVDLRFIAATNEDLDRMIARKAFRKDLYYRIRGGWLHLPPLRERADDIPLLIDAFMEKYENYAGTARKMTPAALSHLAAYDWPGNVRELKSIVQSAVNLARGRPVDTGHLPEHLRRAARHPARSTDPSTHEIRTMAEVEKEHILKIYRRLNGNKSHSAKALGIGLNTLRRKLDSYGIE
jgi:transcriptional regulator with PAS, ATPase and Fis domain